VRGVGGGRVAAVRRRVRAGRGRRRVPVGVALPVAVSMPMAAVAVPMAPAAAVDEVGHVALHAAVVAVHVVPSAHVALVHDR
jgi:hypothetical protein